jgi:squalene synthase HpnC
VANTVSWAAKTRARRPTADDARPPRRGGAGLVDALDRRSRSENFPVASRLLPRRLRCHLLALYGFARLTDDLGDEAPGDRLARLAWLEVELGRAFEGRATDPVLARLTPTIRAFDLSPEPFRRLIEANRVDQRVSRYATWDDLRAYCALSADPIGHLVLALTRSLSPERARLSDDVCTALQLVEHVQDVGEDYRRGRIYLPREDLDHYGCPESDFDLSVASPAVRRVVAFECDRARDLLRSGHALAVRVRGSARVAVCGFAGGGLAAVNAIERAGYDVLGAMPRPARAWTMARAAALWSSARRRRSVSSR